jgi:hypothetical protein
MLASGRTTVRSTSTSVAPAASRNSPTLDKARNSSSRVSSARASAESRPTFPSCAAISLSAMADAARSFGRTTVRNTVSARPPAAVGDQGGR